MTKISSTNYFVPITIWKYEKDENTTLYRFAYGTEKFWTSFVKKKEEDEKLTKIWKKYKVFYSLVFWYYGNFARGSSTVIVGNSTKFPYETNLITPFTKNNNNKSFTNFRPFLYPFPGTTLLYLSVKQNEIHDVLLYDKEAQQDEKITKKYNFLPDPKQENKKISWDKKYSPFITKFLYVYDFKPTFSRWQPNGENVCLPSHEGYFTIEECIDSVRDNIKNKDVFVQTDSFPLYEIANTSKHPYHLQQKNIPSVFDLFLIFLFLFIVLLLSSSNRKNYKRKKK